jgi:uncharacterized protein (TIGR02246 family)
MRKWRLFSLTCGLAAMAIGLTIGVGRMPARGDDQKLLEAANKGKRVTEFIDAFNKGDATAVASFWTPDATYTDEVGNVIKGRPAIEKLYQKVFADRKGAKLTIHVESAKLLTPEVGIEEGVTEVTPAEGGPPTSARFTAVLVKREGQWYFETVNDSIVQPPSNGEHFEDLEWLLGDWTGEAEKGVSATASYAWSDNRNFIVSSFATTMDGVPVVGGTQWIAWDAVDKQIRSYTFYSRGGIGEATWAKEGDSWVSKVNAKTAGGKRVSATNTLTKTDADHATWTMSMLTVDGKEMPAPPPVKMKRVKLEKS